MKRIYHLLLLPLLLCGAHLVYGQGSTNATGIQNETEPIAFTIVEAQTGLSTTWYIESHAISDAAGEQIASFEGDARSSMISQLKSLQDNPEIVGFELDEKNNQLVIAMQGMDAKDLFQTLSNEMRHPSTH